MPLTFNHLDIQEFRTALECVVFALDTGSYRYALGHVCMENDGDDATVFVATDGRQLASYRIEGYSLVPERQDNCLPHEKHQLLLHGKDCKAFLATIGATADQGRAVIEYNNCRDGVIGTLRLTWRQRSRGASWKECEATIRIESGRFPRWRDVCPAKRSSYLSGTAEDFLANMPNFDDAGYLFDLNGHVHLAPRIPQYTWNRVKWHGGETMQVAFNMRLLESWLRSLPGDKGKQQVRLELEPEKPALGKCGNGTYVLMPLYK